MGFQTLRALFLGHPFLLAVPLSAALTWCLLALR